MNSEDEVQQHIQMEAPKHNAILMRNNSGALTDATGRTVRYGLGHTSKKQNQVSKSSDLIGITVVTITPDMVGKQIGVFTAIEVKKPDWKQKPVLTDTREIAQQNFIDFIRSKFGFAGFAKDLNDFHKIIGK